MANELNYQEEGGTESESCENSSPAQRAQRLPLSLELIAYSSNFPLHLRTKIN